MTLHRMDICKAPMSVQCGFNSVVHKETDKIQRIKKITFARAIRSREYREGGKVRYLQSVNALEVGDLQSANGFIAHGYTLYKYTGLTVLCDLIIQMLPKL